MSLLSFKLNTGEDVIAKAEIKGDYAYLIWPMKIITVYSADIDEPKNRVEAYAQHVKGHSVKIPLTNIMFYGEPVAPLAEYYDKTFGTMLPKAPEEIDASVPPEEIKVDNVVEA